MLWLALQFPLLPLESLLPVSAQSEAWAIADGSKVIARNSCASVQGVRVGMTLSAACALVPDLLYRSRNKETESTALDRLAMWAGQFTSAVSLQGAHGMVLEIEGSLKLFGGIRRLVTAVKKGCADMGHTVVMACAPTIAAAWLMAHACVQKVIVSKTMLREALGPLPVTALDCDERALKALGLIGVHTLAQLLALPRDGIAQRFGQPLLNQLDRALGVLPEARQFFVAPARFVSSLELPSTVSNAEALLFAARRLLTQLAGFLASRSGGIERFNVHLLHEDVDATRLEIRLTSPTRELERFVGLTRERFAAVALAAPVYKITVEADDVVAVAGTTTSLFPETINDTGNGHRLIERLRARLGPDAVQGLMPTPEYRPELSWNATHPGVRTISDMVLARPLWLLEEPRPLREVQSRLHYGDEALTLIAGPEIIESGWWDGDVKRDYFVAQTSASSTYWIFRERRESGAWYLHGIFG